MADQRKAHFALSGAKSSGTVEAWEGYVFHLREKNVVVDGIVIRTTAKEFGLALLLFRNLSKALSREDILRAVWGVTPGTPSRSLDAHISQIRNRLGLKPQNGFLLTSVYNFGYRLELLSTWERTEPRGADNRAQPEVFSGRRT